MTLISLISRRADRRVKADSHLGRYTPTETDAGDVLGAIDEAAGDNGYETLVWAIGEPDEESLKSWQYHHDAPDAEYILQREDAAGADDEERWVYGEPETLEDVEGYKVRTIEELHLVWDVHEDPTFVDFYVPGDEHSSEETEEFAVRYESGRRWRFLSKDGESQAQELVDAVTDDLND